MTYKIETMIPERFSLGESPLWDHRVGQLFWIDSLAPAIHTLSPDQNTVCTWKMPSIIGSIGMRFGGGLVACLQTGFAEVDLSSGAVTVRVDPEPDLPANRLNDGKVCASGRYWVGSHCDESRMPTGSLYRINPDFSVQKADTGLTIGNGIALSPDETTLYVADTPALIVHAYDHNPATGRIGNKRVFVDYATLKGRPDGAAVDRDGNYWSAMVRGGTIGCFTSNGDLIRTIPLPVEHPTMCSFGGPRFDILYVTSTRHLSTDSDRFDPQLAGTLLRITGLGAIGLPAHQFGQPAKYLE